MRLVSALRAFRGYRSLAALLSILLPVTSLAAQGEATSGTMRNVGGSFMQAFLELALPVALVIGAIYLLMNWRRRRR